MRICSSVRLYNTLIKDSIEPHVYTDAAPRLVKLIWPDPGKSEFFFRLRPTAYDSSTLPSAPAITSFSPLLIITPMLSSPDSLLQQEVELTSAITDGSLIYYLLFHRTPHWTVDLGLNDWG